MSRFLDFEQPKHNHNYNKIIKDCDENVIVTSI